MPEDQSTPVVAGINGLPKVVLTAGDGARAEVYLHFVCVEAAVIGQPVNLPPAASWQGSQVLLVE